MGYENSGRRPQPTALKMLRGNPSKTKPNPAEPRPPSGAVVKPETLSAGAGVIWDELAPVCLYMGTLTLADVRPFGTLCELQDQFDAIVRTKGTEEFSIRQLLDTAGQLRPYYALFGLEPVSRARISVPKAAAPVSKWAGVLK